MVNFNDQTSILKEGISSKTILIISGIIIGSFITRIYFMNFEIPLTNDALTYFFYAIDIKINNQLPVNYSLANPGWGIFLSGFFSNFESQSVIDYMNLQRILSISISSLTVLPVYLLSKKFFNSSLSLLAGLVIGFEPHLIQNSLFGISDSLYIFLVATSFWLYFNEDMRIRYVSFFIVGLATIVRAESIFILMTFLIMIIPKSDGIRNKVRDVAISGLIFSMVFLPVAIIQFENYGDDRAFGRVGNTINAHIVNPEKSTESAGFDFLINGIQNFPKYLGWSLIPIFLPLLPIGFILMFKDWSYRVRTVFTGLILMSMPPFYAYAISIQDVRYLFFLYPLFVILSMYTIQKAGTRFNQRTVFTLIICFVLVSSGAYCTLKIDNHLNNENMVIAQLISETPKKINGYHQSQYLEPLNYPERFDEFEKFYELERIDTLSVRFVVPQQVTVNATINDQSVEDFIFLNQNELTHIIVEEDEESELYDVFMNEKEYPYLKKELDTGEMGFGYHVKLFKIDYEEFLSDNI